MEQTSTYQISHNTAVAPDVQHSTATYTREHSHGQVGEYLSKGCTLVAFLLPIKLSLTYIALVPLLLAWVFTYRSEVAALLRARAAAPIIAPLSFFLALAAASTCSGISALHSIPSLLSLAFFALTVPLFAVSARSTSVAVALLAGQSIAALHSFLDAALPNTLPRLFLGKVTESGQLAITAVVALGVCMMWYRALSREQRDQAPIAKQPQSILFLGLCTAAALTVLGFRSEAALTWPLTTALTALLLGCLAYSCHLMRGSTSARAQLILLSTIQIPLLLCALLVNLKRGPWLGTIIGTSLFLLLYARRLALAMVAGAIVFAAMLPPVQQRLLDSYEHFTIAGGRSTIWRIGAELASEYPLGIGYHNSGILRQFAPEIPSELKHFHNNLINIAAETGWLGMAVFMWFIISVVKLCLQDRAAPLYIAIGCAIVSWQVAGLVEYNFGDSEITLVVWALLGLVLQRELRTAQTLD